MSSSTTQSEQENSLKVLIQAVHMAQSRGVYTFEEAELLSKCIRKFVKTPEETPAQPKSTAPTPVPETKKETVVI